MSHPSGLAIPLVSVLRAMHHALNSFDAEEIFCEEFIMRTLKELSRFGLTSEPGDDFNTAWQRLGEEDPLTRAVIEEGYTKLLKLRYIVVWPCIPKHQGNIRISENGTRWAQSEGPVPNWGS